MNEIIWNEPTLRAAFAIVLFLRAAGISANIATPQNTSAKSLKWQSLPHHTGVCVAPESVKVAGRAVSFKFGRQRYI